MALAGLAYTRRLHLTPHLALAGLNRALRGLFIHTSRLHHFRHLALAGLVVRGCSNLRLLALPLVRAGRKRAEAPDGLEEAHDECGIVE